MKIEELLERQHKLNLELFQVEREIRDYDDGFNYVVVIKSYCQNEVHYCTNIHNARAIASEYNGDNGFSDIYTDNKSAKCKFWFGGDLYYHEHAKSITRDCVIEGAILLSNED